MKNAIPFKLIKILLKSVKPKNVMNLVQFKTVKNQSEVSI